MKRTKKCKHCKEEFLPYTSLQKYCTKEECVRVFVAEAKEKEWKKTKAKKKEELMTVQDWIKIAQQVFNKYIRERDKGKGCISCGKPLIGKFDAGHFYNANNHWAVRFDERNVHGQCVNCNQHKHGNLLEYRARLMFRLGDGMEGISHMYNLEMDAKKTRKYSIDELKNIVTLYKQKLKEL